MLTVFFWYLLLFLIVGATVIMGIYLVLTTISAAPFVPVPRAAINTMLKLADLKPTDALIDLGSGDGRIVFAAAKSKAGCIGVEINPLLYWYSRIKKFVLGMNNVEFRREDLWKSDVSAATVITIYFIPSRMDKLQEKLQKELRPGARVVSYKFKFEDWGMEDWDGDVYLYRI